MAEERDTIKARILKALENPNIVHKPTPIAEALGVSPNTVSTTLKRLKGESVVNKGDYDMWAVAKRTEH